MSDIQLAKVTPDYNTEVAEERVIEYANKVVELTNVQRSAHPVNKCVVLAAGDIVEGELIFPGQTHLIDASLYNQVTIDGPRILTKFFDILLANFNEVEVHWVIGNHGSLGGRARKDYHPDSNADRMLGKILSMTYSKENRISFTIPDSTGDNHWFDIANLGDGCKFLYGTEIIFVVIQGFHGMASVEVVGMESISVKRTHARFRLRYCRTLAYAYHDVRK